jgi:hypothetical protein
MLTGKLGAIACSTISDFSVALWIYEGLMIVIWRKSPVLMKKSNDHASQIYAATHLLCNPAVFGSEPNFNRVKPTTLSSHRSV